MDEIAPGPNARAKGQNGVFRPVAIRVWVFQSAGITDSYVCIDIVSKANGYPAYVQIDADEARALGRELMVRADELDPPPPPSP